MIRHFYLWKQSDEYRTWKAERPLQYVEQAIPDYHADVCDVRKELEVFVFVSCFLCCVCVVFG